MKIIDKMQNKLKKTVIFIRRFGDNVMKKNSNFVIRVVSIVLIMAWMLLFIKFPESFVVNIFFLAINTFLIVYLVETGKNKENVNMERIILISSILFCSLCCFMEYINKLTLPFIILSLLIVYLINFLKVISKLLNIHKEFFIFSLISAIVIGSISAKYWQILAMVFLRILYENEQNKDYNIKENNIKYKLKKIKSELDFINFLIYNSILVSDYLYELKLVNRITDFLFYCKLELELNDTIGFLFYLKYKLELNFTKGFLTIVVFTVLYIITALLKKYINKRYPKIKENLAHKIFDDWL